MATVDQIIGAESGGNPYARNPRSSAGGSGQFIDSTWLEMIKRYRPDVAQGKSDAQLLQLKFDPNLSREMTQAYADQNSAFLRSKGIDPTPGNTYLAHFAGPSGAAAIHSDPGATVEALLGPQAVAANPFLRGKTGQDVIDWANRKMSPAQHMAKNLRQRYAAAPSETVPAETGATGVGGMERLRAALSGKSYDPDKITQGQRLQQQGQAIGGNATNWLGALGGTFVSGLGGYLEGKEKEGQQAYQTQLRDTLSNASDPMQAARALMASPDPQQQAAGIQMFSKLSTAASRGGNESFGKSIEYGVDEQGNPVPLQFSDRGRGVMPELPPGVKIGGKKPVEIDAGTHTILLDPVTRQPIGQVPKNLAEAESEKAVGKARGVDIAQKPQARLSLGSALSNFDRMATVARELKEAEGLEAMTGYSSHLPTVWQSTADAKAKLETMKSQIATNVLQAMREASKTGGALGSTSDTEIMLLQNNLAPLMESQSMPAFKKALDDVIAYTEGAKTRLRGAYEDTYGETFTPPEASSGDKKTLKYNRQTGKFE